jgi:hypothetical protein
MLSLTIFLVVLINISEEFSWNTFFLAKPEDFRNFFWLVLNQDEIQILAQKNSYYPQIYFYDFADFSPENVKSIHYILEFQAQYTTPPSVIYNPLNNKL